MKITREAYAALCAPPVMTKHAKAIFRAFLRLGPQEILNDQGWVGGYHLAGMYFRLEGWPQGERLVMFPDPGDEPENADGLRFTVPVTMDLIAELKEVLAECRPPRRPRACTCPSNKNRRPKALESTVRRFRASTHPIIRVKRRN